MVKAKKFILKKHFDGLPKPGDLEVVEEELPPLKDGEFLAQALFLSVDPYMRIFSKSLQIGESLMGAQIAKIVESKSKDYPVGVYVEGFFGWRNYTVSSKDKPDKLDFGGTKILSNFGDLPLSLGLGVLGMPGATSYFGFLELCAPKEGDIVVVSGAAGAVGSHVGQIAKIKGCKVIGITGSDEKGQTLVNEFGFDKFINYKKPDFPKKLAEYAPDGIDSYFDNVGGEISSAVLNQMKHFGRISVCGAITAYNSEDMHQYLAPIIQPSMVPKELKMEGFAFTRWLDRYNESVEQNIQWIKEGKLKYKETVTVGFENAFQAFVDMLQGGNIGKAIVKV